MISENIDYSVESACLYWRYLGARKSNTNDFADEGYSKNDIWRVSANVNGWIKDNGSTLPKEPIGLNDRIEKFNKIAKELKLK